MPSPRKVLLRNAAIWFVLHAAASVVLVSLIESPGERDPASERNLVYFLILWSPAMAALTYFQVRWAWRGATPTEAFMREITPAMLIAGAVLISTLSLFFLG